MAHSDKATGDEKNEHVFSDDVTKEKITKHLSDINDTISDEDINNVITDINSDEHIDNEIEADNKKVADSIILPDEEAPQITTTWDVID
ncbi:MAG: hypothetical protein M3015_02930 [Bacteroidota bacterium]|nr:hypothetical protein [Bacteroidota bacterium]